MVEMIAIGIGVALVLLFLAKGVAIIRPTHKGIVERMGKYNRIADSGLVLLIPFFDNLIYINTTEQMIDAKSQEIITKDNLNAEVDAQIYFKVKNDEDSLKKSQYAVNNYQYQVVSLARTTLRNIIGNLTLKEANSQRGTLNDTLAGELKIQAQTWGIEIVRAELKEISPPSDVQETMNKVVKAENEKIASIDTALALENQADGKRKATIKEAEGERQKRILEAEGKGTAIETIAKAEANQVRIVCEAQEKYFIGNSQLYKKLETAQAVLKDNAKILIGTDKNLSLVISEVAGITPIEKSEPKKKEVIK